MTHCGPGQPGPLLLFEVMQMKLALADTTLELSFFCRI